VTGTDATDTRIACGMPCTFTTAREIYVPRTHYHDAEQNLDGAISKGLDYDDFYTCFAPRKGLDYDDFYTCFAPRPAAIGAVTYDFFPIEGTRLAYERLRHVYSLFDAEDRIALFEVDSGHMYHPVLRRNAIEWFNRWLQPEAEFREPSSFSPEPAESLRNTSTGQVSTSIPEAKGVFEQNLEAVQKAKATRHAPSPEELAELLGIPSVDCPLNARIIETYEEGDLRLEKGFIVPEVGIVMPVLRIAPEQPSGGLVYCCDGGVESINQQDEMLFRKLAAKGLAVYLVEPRGSGETRSRLLGATRQVTDSWLAEYLRMLGTSTAALRAYDLTRAFEYVRRRQSGVGIRLVASGLVCWSAVLLWTVACIVSAWTAYGPASLLSLARGRPGYLRPIPSPASSAWRISLS